MVRYALLGLLREQRDYGYRLKRRFDERVGAIWHLNIGQVYQTLRALERAGMVSTVDAPDGQEKIDSYPARRLYELTPKGHRTLDQWIQRPPIRPQPIRDETLIRLLILDTGHDAEALTRISAQEALYRRYLDRLLSQRRRAPKRKGVSLLVSHLGLEAALLHAEAHIKWLAYCREHIEAAILNSRVTGTSSAKP